MNAYATQRGPEERGSRSFVVNLCASTTPVALAPPEEPAFASYQFFVTRRREEGRDRFRLHMGYFASLAEARDMVEELRRRYPTAWAGPAPRGTTPETGAGSPPAVDALDALSNVRQVLATLDMDRPERALLTPTQQWSLLETGKLPDPHFAVQLIWSGQPIDISTLPQPALFDVYTLYHVEGLRDGRRWYGLRLGFFTDVDAAKRVACYLKPDFEGVAVVPVTEAERDGAQGEGESRVLRQAFPDTASVRSPGDGVTPEPTLPRITPFGLDNPLKPEPVLLPVPNGIALDGGLAAPEPFVLNPQGPVSSMPPPVAPRSTLDIRTPDVAPADASIGAARPDRRILDLLGASALSVAEDAPVAPRPKPTEQAESKLDELSASAIRRMKGLAKLFGRPRG